MDKGERLYFTEWLFFPHGRTRFVACFNTVFWTNVVVSMLYDVKLLGVSLYIFLKLVGSWGPICLWVRKHTKLLSVENLAHPAHENTGDPLVRHTGCPGVAPAFSQEAVRPAPGGLVDQVGRAVGLCLTSHWEYPSSRWWFHTNCSSMFLKAQPRETVFMEDYLKYMQSVHSSRYPKTYPWIMNEADHQ